MKKKSVRKKCRNKRYSKRSNAILKKRIFIGLGVCSCYLLLNWLIGYPPSSMDAKHRQTQRAPSLWQNIVDVGRYKQSHNKGLLYEHVNHEDKRIRKVVMESMGEMGDWNDIPHMIEGLTDPSQDVRQTANRSIARLMGIDYHLDHGNESDRMENMEWIKEHYESEKKNFDDWKARQEQQLK